MPVIALTHEMGSLAKDVALQLAATLNLKTLRHEVVEHVAEKMHVSKSLINRLREGKAGLIERMKADDRSIAVYTAHEVLELADQGNVVLRGWGATCLLRPVPHVVCVRVTRPLGQRVDWLMEHLGIDDRAFAEAEIRRSDHAHATNMHNRFGVTWGDPLLYDLVLNTERLSIDGCVAQIAALVERPEFAETAASRALLHNMTIDARIQAVLKEHAGTHDIDITIESTNGAVTLRGIVLDEQQRSRADAMAASVPGVVSVDNQLRVMAKSRLFTSAKY